MPELPKSAGFGAHVNTSTNSFERKAEDEIERPHLTSPRDLRNAD